MDRSSHWTSSTPTITGAFLGQAANNPEGGGAYRALVQAFRARVLAQERDRESASLWLGEAIDAPVDDRLEKVRQRRECEGNLRLDGSALQDDERSTSRLVDGVRPHCALANPWLALEHEGGGALLDLQEEAGRGVELGIAPHDALGHRATMASVRLGEQSASPVRVRLNWSTRARQPA